MDNEKSTTAEWSLESNLSFLDLFSTSPTKQRFGGLRADTFRCVNSAPFFAYHKDGRTYGVVQGCCNSWTCPRCGVLVAKQHYGRIVEGCRVLAKDNSLAFITLTCKGKELTESEAMRSYLTWTNRFLDAARVKQKRAKEAWHYVQVTEKQKRGHPHSHVITTFVPSDLIQGHVESWKRDNRGILVAELKPALRSAWVAGQVVKSGLGNQYDISIVASVEGASRYVAKYLFKPAQFQTHYPPKWKRVRYSQDFPQLPERKTDAFVLMSREDWNKLQSVAAVVITSEQDAHEIAQYYLQQTDTLVSLKSKTQE